MYVLISAIAKKLKGDARWVNLDIGEIALNSLFANYSKIIATLTNPFLTAAVALDLENIRPAVGGESITFNAFLLQNGNESLTTSNTLPVLRPRIAHYADAFHAGYKITPVPPTAAVDAHLPTPERTWLHLTRPSTDYNLFYKSCLVNINGFFHLTDYDTHGVYVKNGMVSAYKSRQNQCGIISFKDLGELTFFAITPSMVYKQDTLQPYRTHCFVNLGIDVSNKTVLLVLGGYLHILDQRTFYLVNDQCFCIDFSNLPLLDRYYESEPYLDLSSLNLETTNRNAHQVGIADLTSDASLVAYLGLAQSFVVVLDNPDVFVNQHFLRHSVLPDMFVSDVTPNMPLVTSVGKIANYWYTSEDGQYSVSCRDTLRSNRVYSTVDTQAENSVSNARITTNPTACSNAYWLEIGCDLI